jgi:regulator of RNase E activity RraB
MTILRLLTIVILAFSVISASAVAQTSIAEQQDARVIDNLRQAGADLSRTHDIDFFLMFTRESSAYSAAAEIEKLGYNVIAIEALPGREQWQVHAKRMMVPKLDAMTAITRGLEALAQFHGGYYDGWGTVAVK